MIDSGEGASSDQAQSPTSVDPKETAIAAVANIDEFLVQWVNSDGEPEHGPLSLLWQLIESYRVDIFDVRLQQITDDFLVFMLNAGELRVELASSFAVMAARLVYYKSRALLPDPGFDESEEEERLPPELIAQLLEYRRFQMAAEKLSLLDESSSGIYMRGIHQLHSGQADSDAKGAAHLSLTDEQQEGEEIWLDLSLVDLVHSYGELLRRKDAELEPQYGYEVVLDEISVDEKMEMVRSLLIDSERFTFSDLFENLVTMARLEIIATFLALLELVRLREIRLRQHALFGEIELFRRRLPHLHG